MRYRWRRLDLPLSITLVPLVFSAIFGGILGVVFSPDQIDDPKNSPVYLKLEEIQESINSLYKLHTPSPTLEPSLTPEPSTVPTPMPTPTPTLMPTPTPEPTCEWVPLETPANTPNPNDVPPCDWTPK